MDENALLDWYDALHNRTLDLVGDYAGSEAFLLEGDSILLHCFSDSRIDIEGEWCREDLLLYPTLTISLGVDGYQLLHVVYVVESFLESLVRRLCKFHIAFFGDHARLCIPPHNEANSSLYILARSVVIIHLERNLKTEHPEIELHNFPSVQDVAFQEYLETSGIYFAMCHDGSFATSGPQGIDKTLDESVDKLRKVALRSTIRHFVTSGFNVALINGLDTRDTKVMAMIVEGDFHETTHAATFKRSSTTQSSNGIPLNEAITKMNINGQSDSVATFLKNWPPHYPYNRDLSSPIGESAGTDFSSEGLALVTYTLSRILAQRSEYSPLASAFLVHALLLKKLPLASRRLREVKFVRPEETKEYRSFLRIFSELAYDVVDNHQWRQYFNNAQSSCDVFDVVDGRLLKIVLAEIQGHLNATDLLPVDVLEKYNVLAGILDMYSGSKVGLSQPHNLSSRILRHSPETSKAPSILPFSNRVFDEHLSSIRIDVDVRDFTDTNGKTARVFREISHWHNHKKALDPVKAVKLRNDKAGQRYLKSNQRYMDEMQKYAASLTNVAGKMLEPQTITVTKGLKPPPSAPPISNKKQPVASGSKKGDLKGKSASSKTKELAQASIEQKKSAFIEKTFASWIVVKDRFDTIVPEVRYQRVEKYLNDLPTDKMNIIGADVILYSLQPLLWIWSGICQANRREEGYRVVALVWSQLNRLWKMESALTDAILSQTSDICHLLNLPSKPDVTANDHLRKLSFTVTIPKASLTSLALNFPAYEFQLLHCGPYMDRNMDSRPDNRVSFHPDGWQRTVLDELDADHSVFVVAPTSAGKTFISFYAMERVLRADDNGVLVYVAPTKALVNQIAAEVQARFSKKYEYGGKSVWAIHTREYRVNNPTGCQILVTVPHILQIMLMSPSNAKSWAPRVKRINFDEIHSIGNADDGVVWEQLLLLAPCPIIALSATVGNPGQFNDWLASTQKSSGYEMTMVTHKHRYSDLRKFIYVPPKKFAFGGLERKSTLGTVGLDGAPGFNFFHPIASLVNKSRGITEDLALEPRDCLSLYKAMKKYQTQGYPVPMDLDPQLSCPPIIQKSHVIMWERKLMELLSLWMADSKSPFDQVLQELRQPLENMQAEDLQVSPTNSTTETESEIDATDLFQTALPLLTSLSEQNALPAILFSFDRSACEKMAQKVFDRLEESEKIWKAESPKWKAKLAAYEKWQKINSSKGAKAVKSKKSSEKDGERTSKADAEREGAQHESSIYESFDPDAPCEEFSFADLTKLPDSDMQDYIKKLEWKGVTGWLVAALKRGIGVHHAGMNRKYRQIVEILFRKGYLRVVIATGTLALGINMPCKTVVFSGDSVFLTALQFRQCAGRAGRRGFDLLGNVVFHCIPLDKACRLLSSRLPDMNGHFPVTTTLVLRLFSLLHDSKDSTYAQRAINSLLSQPRLYLGGESFRDQVLHHVRFSIEYLRRQQLLGPRGEPINFTSCVSHLYFTENSAFAFHALLKAGYFHTLCASIQQKSQSTLRQLMLVMAHLFGRLPCRLSDIAYMETLVKKYSSVVILPELPPSAQEILSQHNAETLEIFTTYVTTFAKQHIKEADRTLPLTGLQVGGSEDISVPALNSLPPTTARSHFVALSGHSDTFTSVSDLCSSTRSGIFLEKAVIPQIDISSAVPLNAYLYDFFIHGDIKTVERANRIRSGQVWEVLNDFSMVLATIVTSFENFLKIVPIDESEMANVSGQGDVLAEYERDETESFAALEASSKAPIAKTAQPVSKAKKKEVVPDSWEGSDSDDETAVTASDTEETFTVRDTESNFDDNGSIGSSSDEGLMNVLVAFRQLKTDFDEKFRAMWA